MDVFYVLITFLIIALIVFVFLEILWDNMVNFFSEAPVPALQRYVWYDPESDYVYDGPMPKTEYCIMLGEL